jgi:hypothetical protein
VGGDHIEISGNWNFVGNRNFSVQVGAAVSSLEQRRQEEMAERLRALATAFEAEKGLVADPDGVRRSLDDVAHQLGSETKPNRLTVTSILRGIADSASAATGVVAAAEQLRELVERLL